METEYKNIYQKLLVIQQRINGLGKDKSTFNYKYVTGDKVLGEIKPIMNELGLILKQEIISIENVRQDYQLVSKDGVVKNKSEILSKVMMRFTWVDTHTGEKDENLFGSNGQNDWDKGVGSALTYGERYFLLKYFHIATDEDDIDNDQRKASSEVTPQPAKPSKPSEPKPAATKKVLNVMNGKDFTAEWLNLVTAINEKKISTIEKVEEHYILTEEVKTKIKELLNY